jgi:hypothetical protein
MRSIEEMFFDVSKSSMGTQVTFELAERETGTFEEGHVSWPRFRAMAAQVQRFLEIKGIFIRADVQSGHWNGRSYMCQVQLSWRMNHDPVQSVQ